LPLSFLEKLKKRKGAAGDPPLLGTKKMNFNRGG
jgi:hypothetical protein